MASYNRIILVGNLTRDPQLSYTPNQTAVCQFGLATNHRWRDKEGNNHEEVCFIDCNIFGRGAEVFNQYMGKGRSVLVEGRLKLEQWTTPEGDKRSKHSIWVENFTFLGSGPGGGGGANYGEQNAAPRSQMNAGRGAAQPARSGYRQNTAAPANANFSGPPVEEPPFEEAPSMGAPGEEPPF